MLRISRPLLASSPKTYRMLQPVTRPNRLSGPSFMVRQAPHLARGLEVCIERQHVDLANKTPGKPAEGQSTSIRRKGGHAIAVEARRWRCQPPLLARKAKTGRCLRNGITGLAMGGGYPPPSGDQASAVGFPGENHGCSRVSAILCSGPPAAGNQCSSQRSAVNRRRKAMVCPTGDQAGLASSARWTVRRVGVLWNRFGIT